MGDDTVFQVRDLQKHFPPRHRLAAGERRPVRAVDGVSFDVRRGEVLGIVGESGCGKSTLGRTMIRLLEPTAGEIRFEGRDLTAMSERELKPLRRRFQMIFQDPHSSLNPRMSVRRILEEPLITHGTARSDRRARVKELLDAVGLPADAGQRYPHEFSGGQLQRVGIARAMALGPEFIVADEPVAALDMSVQAQVLNLMIELKEELGLTYLLIAHDLAVVEHISDRVAVMYLGQLVESADRDALYRQPLHPYTQALMQAIPLPDPTRSGGHVPLRGEVPDPADPPSACRFHTRCPFAEDVCREEAPAFRQVRPGHRAACHFAERFLAQAAPMGCRSPRPGS